MKKLTLAGCLILVVVALAVTVYTSREQPEPPMESVDLTWEFASQGWTPTPAQVDRVCHDACLRYCAKRLGYCRKSGGEIDGDGNIRCSYRCFFVL